MLCHQQTTVDFPFLCSKVPVCRQQSILRDVSFSLGFLQKLVVRVVVVAAAVVMSVSFVLAALRHIGSVVVVQVAALMTFCVIL